MTNNFPLVPTTEFLRAQGFDPNEQVEGTLVERISVGCVDMPTKRMDSQEVLDDTLYCGWYQVSVRVSELSGDARFNTLLWLVTGVHSAL